MQIEDKNYYCISCGASWMTETVHNDGCSDEEPPRTITYRCGATLFIDGDIESWRDPCPSAMSLIRQLRREIKVFRNG